MWPIAEVRAIAIGGILGGMAIGVAIGIGFIYSVICHKTK